MKDIIKKLLRENSEPKKGEETEEKIDRVKYQQVKDMLTNKMINNAYIAKQINMDRSEFRKRRDEAEGMSFSNEELNTILSLVTSVS